VVDPEEADRLERSMTNASGNLKKSLGGKPGDSSEKVYASTYQGLVRAGLRPQLRKKYR
jgi:hypothetical protein